MSADAPQQTDEEIIIDKDSKQEPLDDSSDSASEALNDQQSIDPEDVEDEAILTLPHEGSVFSVHWNQSNPNLVVTGGEEEKAFVWDLTTKSSIITIPPRGKLGESVTIVKFSPNGTKVAVAALNGVIQVWDVVKQKKVCDCNGCSGELSFLEWDASNRGLFGGDDNGLVYVWSALTGNNFVLSGHQDAVTCGCFSPDGFSFFYPISSYFS